MNDNDLNLALVGRLVRYRWPVLVLLAVVGSLVGAASSLVLSPGYQSSSKVLLQGSRDKETLRGEAQIAGSLVVLDRTAQGLQWGETGNDLRGKISATLLDGNVIEIVGTAATPERAQQLTDRATREYIAFSTQIVNDARAAYDDVSKQNRDRVQQQIDQTQQRITQLEGSPEVSVEGPDGIKARDELTRAHTTLEQAKSELDKLDEKDQTAELEGSLGQAAVRVIEPAVVPTGAASPTVVELAAGGAVALTLIGIFAHLIAMRSDQRLRAESAIAAAAGTVLLGSVEVAADRPQPRFSLRDDRRWAESDLHVSDDERSRTSRFRRALDRVRGEDGRVQLLVLLSDDDPSAVTTVVDLAVAATKGGRSVSVVTDDDGLADPVRRAADRSGVGNVLRVGAGDLETHTVIEVSALQARRPLVSTATPGRAATVLVVTAGTRTGWELTQIAAACAEAGRRLDGVVVATPTAVERAGGPARPGGRGAVPGAMAAVRA